MTHDLDTIQAALEAAKDKLAVYYKQTLAEYGGGEQYDYVVQKIDRALSLVKKMRDERNKRDEVLKMVYALSKKSTSKVHKDEWVNHLITTMREIHYQSRDALGLMDGMEIQFQPPASGGDDE